MIKIDLNIKIDDLEPKKDFKDKKPIDVSKKFIETAFNWLQTKLKDPRNPASAGLTISEQRKIYKILDVLDNHKDGIIEIEDDFYNFLKETFNKVEWIGGTRIVVRIADKIDAQDKSGEKDG